MDITINPMLPDRRTPVEMIAIRSASAYLRESRRHPTKRFGNIMINSIVEFERLWSYEVEATQKVMKHLTTASLPQAVDAQGRTLGRIAWHIVLSIPEMMTRIGFSLEGPGTDAPIPVTAKEIFAAYNTVALSLLEQIKKNWTDETLTVKDEMYGEQWTRGFTLQSMILHQTHHRGQMTVLMRQAGLDVPGVYGPARQEWVAYGMAPPEL